MFSAVPWGTREQVLGNEYERLGKGDLYGSVCEDREASPLDEPRTPCIIECRGVSDYHDFNVRRNPVSNHSHLFDAKSRECDCMISAVAYQGLFSDLRMSG